MSTVHVIVSVSHYEIEALRHAVRVLSEIAGTAEAVNDYDKMGEAISHSRLLETFIGQLVPEKPKRDFFSASQGFLQGLPK